MSLADFRIAIGCDAFELVAYGVLESIYATGPGRFFYSGLGIPTIVPATPSSPK